MITDADIKKLKAVFANKDDITEIKQKLDDVKTRLEILEDNVTGEIAKLHDENIVTSSYREKIEDHEGRLTTIEAKLAI